MSDVYVIVEYGETYPAVYTNYLAAKAAVLKKHETVILEQQTFLEEGFDYNSDVDVPEDPSGTTHLHIAVLKLNITISRLPLKSH